MKKKLIYSVLFTTLIVMLNGCGNTTTPTTTDGTTETETQTTEASSAETVAQQPIDAKTKVDFDSTIGEIKTDSVEIPDYSTITVTVPKYTLTDDEINTQINNEYSNLVYQSDSFKYTDLDKDTVENGDVVLLDFEGKINNETFDNGSAKDYHLEIGSGAFIDGIESNIVGMKVGDTKDIPVTFPEDYQVPDLAGKDAVFTVTIKKIQSREMPEMTDDVIKSLQIGVETVDDFKNGIRNHLNNTLVTMQTQAENSAIESALIEAIPVEVTDEQTNIIVDKMMLGLQAEADKHGESLEEYFKEHMDVTIDQYKKDCKSVAIDMAKKLIIFSAIADKEGIFVSEEAIDRQAENDYANMGYESKEDYLANVDKQSLYDFILENNVIGAIKDKLNLVDGESQSIVSTY